MGPASYCHVPHCHNTKYHFAFYKFPSNAELRQKWINACKMKDASAHMYACEKHFRSWDFTKTKKGKKKLKRGENTILLIGGKQGHQEFDKNVVKLYL